MGYTGDKKRQYQNQWMKNRRKEFLRDKVCSKCGTTENLTLHHVDRESKISHRIWSWSKARRDAEIAKCKILCKACHQELHAEELRALCPSITHGTSSTYKSGCRCPLCREASRRYNKAYREGRCPSNIIIEGAYCETIANNRYIGI